MTDCERVWLLDEALAYDVSDAYLATARDEATARRIARVAPQPAYRIFYDGVWHERWENGS